MPVSTKNFEQHLYNIARGYASLATRLAKGYAPNTHLRESIHSVPERKGKAEFKIKVWAKGPDARAREYGSGVWARRGPKGKILIKPKNKKALAFPWEVATSPISGEISPNVPRLPDGRVLLKQVEHPGVEAANEGKGYLGPAINDTRKALRKKMKKEGAAAIRLDMRAAFKVKGVQVNVR